jgi:hypothetical protein
MRGTDRHKKAADGEITLKLIEGSSRRFVDPRARYDYLLRRSAILAGTGLDDGG